MSGSNDVLNVINADFRQARQHGEKAANATLRAAIHLLEAINAERFGRFAEDWFARDPKTSGTLATVLKVAECDADSIKRIRADNKDEPGVAAALVDAARVKQRDYAAAFQAAHAMRVLCERTGEQADIRPGKSDRAEGTVLIPAVWFLPLGDKPEHAAPLEQQREAIREVRLTATDKNGKHAVYYMTNDGMRKVIAARDNGQSPDIARMERRDMVSVSREGVVRAAFPPSKPQPAVQEQTAPKVDAASVKNASETLGSFLANVNGGAVTGDTADSIATIIAHIAHNDSLWSLALAEREAFKKERDKEDKAAA